MHSGTVDALCDDCTVLDIVEDDTDELAVAVRTSEGGSPTFVVKPSQTRLYQSFLTNWDLN